jgi:hypothetical protein
MAKRWRRAQDQRRRVRPSLWHFPVTEHRACPVTLLVVGTLRIPALALEVLGRALSAKLILAPSEDNRLIENLLSDIGVRDSHVLAMLMGSTRQSRAVNRCGGGGELFIYKR